MVFSCSETSIVTAATNCLSDRRRGGGSWKPLLVWDPNGGGATRQVTQQTFELDPRMADVMAPWDLET